MKDILVPIDQAGRIVLPKRIRQELAVKPGDTFKVSVVGMAVTLIPNKENAGFVREGKALVFTSPGDEELSVEVAQEILDSTRAERDAGNTEGLSDRRRQE